MDVNVFIETLDSMWADIGNALPDYTQEQHHQAFELISRFHNVTDELFSSNEYRRSTAHIGTLINLSVSLLDDYECYLNIGVWKGYTLFAGAIGNPNNLCVGVDQFDPEYLLSMEPRHDVHVVKNSLYQVLRKLNLTNIEIFEMNCQDFLSQYVNHVPKKIGVFFYDADHGTEATLKALDMAKPHFSSSCLVILDDYNNPTVRTALEIWLSDNPCFQVLLELHTLGDGHPTWWNGIVLLTRK